MSTTLYVGNLPPETTAADLFTAFGRFGTVTGAEVIDDRHTGRSRGFGFVVMSDGAIRAAAELNGGEFQGRPLVVIESRSRADCPPSHGAGGPGG